MLGPPNRGTFTVVQGIRGTHWVLDLLSVIDGRHSAAELATAISASRRAAAQGWRSGRRRMRPGHAGRGSALLAHPPPG